MPARPTMWKNSRKAARPISTCAWLPAGGLSLIASGLLAERVPDNPCKVAIGGTAESKNATAKESGVADSILGNIKKLFGR